MTVHLVSLFHICPTARFCHLLAAASQDRKTIQKLTHQKRASPQHNQNNNFTQTHSPSPPPSSYYSLPHSTLKQSHHASNCGNHRPNSSTTGPCILQPHDPSGLARSLGERSPRRHHKGSRADERLSLGEYAPSVQQRPG